LPGDLFAHQPNLAIPKGAFGYTARIRERSFLDIGRCMLVLHTRNVIVHLINPDSVLDQQGYSGRHVYPTIGTSFACHECRGNESDMK
jgi:hypothetical protein